MNVVPVVKLTRLISFQAASNAGSQGTTHTLKAIIKGLVRDKTLTLVVVADRACGAVSSLWSWRVLSGALSWSIYLNITMGSS